MGPQQEQNGPRGIVQCDIYNGNHGYAQLITNSCQFAVILAEHTSLDILAAQLLDLVIFDELNNPAAAIGGICSQIRAALGAVIGYGKPVHLYSKMN